MPQSVRRNVLVAQGRAALFCGLNVLFEHIFESRPAHCTTTRIEEEFRYGSLATYRQPRTKISASSFPNWQYSFSPSFPENPNGRLRRKGYVFHLQTDQLGDSESCDKTHIQHGAITDAKPSMGVGYVQDRLHFVESDIRHQLRISPFERYCQDLPHLVQCGWHLILDVAHERFDGRQAAVSRHRPVFALGLDVLQEGEHHSGIDLFQVKLRWRRGQASGSVLKQQAECVRISIAGVLARAAIDGEALAQECGDMGRQWRHDWLLLPKASDRSATCASIEGVAWRYQYVLSIWPWPR